MECIPGYDEQKTTPPEPKVLKYCDICSTELQRGESAYIISGECFCPDCIEGFKVVLEDE